MLTQTSTESQARTISYLFPVLALGLTFGAYFVLRYLGFWTEQDTAVFARIISQMVDNGSLRSPGAYTHGYAYPVWAATLSQIVGVSVTDFLQLYSPLIGNMFLGIFGFVAFRRLLATDRLGFLATSLLFMVPELVFTVSRGNHEKLTVALTFLALLALVKSFVEKQWQVLAAWVVVLHLTNFTLITLNAFFGSSFTVATTFTLVVIVMLRVFRPLHGASLGFVARRLVLVVGVSWLLFVLVTLYLYPSSSDTLKFFESAVERLSELATSFNSSQDSDPDAPEAEPSFSVADPYAVSGTDWINVRVYQVLSSFRWVLFIGSLFSCGVLLVRAWRKLEVTPLRRLFLLTFYLAFGLRVAVAVPIDFLNLSAGTNLQVRMYTYFALLAPPLLVLGVAECVRRLKSRGLRTFTVSLMVLSLSGFAFLSVLKSTLDPAVSNRWLFYHPAEVQAMRFWTTEAWNTDSRPGPLWIDIQARALYAYRTTYTQETATAQDFAIRPGIDVSYALYSPLFREATLAWERPPPSYWLENRPYDNGEVQIFQRIPETPFQR